MSRQELSAHHAAHKAVAGHELPDEGRMRAMLLTAGLWACDIVDVPGRYLVRAIK
jgi:hypothetical protein